MKSTHFAFTGFSIILIGFIYSASSDQLNSIPKRIKPGNNTAFIDGGPTIKRIQKNGLIRIGMQKDLHPYHIADPVDDFPGIDVELAQRLAKYLGVKFEISFFSLQELMQNVHDHKLDLAFGGVSSNLNRSPKVYFSRPYIITTAGALIAVKSLPRESSSIEYNPKRFRSLHDLSQAGILSLGVKSNTSNHELIEKDEEFKKHKLKLYDTNSLLIEALKSGEIDAMIADSVFIKSLLTQDKSLQRKYIAMVQEYRPEYISIILPRGDIGLKIEIDFFLDDLERRGILNQLLSKYL